MALPQKPLSEMTDDEIKEAIRELRTKRVVATTRARGPRGAKKAQNDEAVWAYIQAGMLDDEEEETK